VIGLALALYYSSGDEPLEFHSPVIIVVEDKAIGNLEGQKVEVLRLNPLRIKIINNDLFVERKGRWKKIDRGKVLILKEQREGLIKGEKFN